VSEEDNIAVVRRQFEATNRRDWATAFAAWDSDVVLTVSDDFLSAGEWRGRDPVGEWFADWFRSFDRDYEFAIEEVDAKGDRVFLFARHGGRGRASGAVVEGSTAYVFTVRHGKICRAELYGQREDALRAF
jgi:ketosteroid isomerase-like protein